MNSVNDHIFWKFFETPFSSWSASLPVAIGYSLGDYNSAHISIIDTSRLRDTNAIFYTPDLHTFRPRKIPHTDPSEYLVHGVVEGEYHCAILYRMFEQANVTLASPFTEYTSASMSMLDRAKDVLQRSRQVGEYCGEWFAMPMTLAIIGFMMEVHKVPAASVHRSVKVLELIEEVVADLPIRGNWHKDIAIMENRVATAVQPGAKQFIELLRYFAKGLVDEPEESRGIEEVEESDEDEGGLTENEEAEQDFEPSPAYQHRQSRKPTNISKPPRSSERCNLSNFVKPARSTRSTKSTKPTKITKQRKDKSAKMQAVKTQRAARLASLLDIDMNRFGGSREGGVINARTRGDRARVLENDDEEDSVEAGDGEESGDEMDLD